MRKNAVELATQLIACDECDLIQQAIPLSAGGWALCRRCEGPLYCHTPGGLDRALALTLGAAALFLIANAFPIIEQEVQGNVSSTSLYGAVHRLWKQGMELLAVLVATTAILLPAFELGLILYVLIPLRFEHVPVAMARSLRWLHAVRPWSMMEIFLLGVLVALVKLEHIADVVIGVALWSFGGMVVLLIGANRALNLRELWKQVPPQ